MSDHPRQPPPGSNEPNQSGDFQAAVSRLEKAVQQLVSVTAGQFSERATSLIEETSKRLESEFEQRRQHDADPEIERGREHRRRRRRQRHRLAESNLSRMRREGYLRRDPRRGKIGGVCAGLARYFGVELWAVRLGAVTGLIFLPTVVFPAYWVTYFVMGKPGRSKSRRRRHRQDNQETWSESEQIEATQPPPNRRPAKQPEFLPRRSLHNTVADFSNVELRLRRLESFVTSQKYELHRELARIERADQEHTPHAS